MKAQSVEEAGSLEAAVPTIAAPDYRKAITTLEEHRLRLRLVMPIFYHDVPQYSE
jgi:hypothetical protein